MVEVDVAVDRAQLSAEHPLERQLRHLEDRDVAAALPGRRGDLGADPAGADRHQPATGLDSLADRLGVRDRAQVQDPVQLRARQRDAARPRAGREQQAIEGQRLAAGQ